MEAVFTEQPERSAGEHGKRQSGTGNLEHFSFLLFPLLLVLTMFVYGCGNGSTGMPLQKTQWFNADALQLKNEGGIFTTGGKPFTGTVYALSLNKKDTVSVGSFFEGKEDGEWRKYFANGQLMEKRYFLNGKKAGVYTGWWPAGKQRLLYHFADGEYEGLCKEWDESGALISEMNYKAGHEEGPQKQYYDNGKIKANYIIKDGRRYGLLGTKNCVNVSDSIFKKK